MTPQITVARDEASGAWDLMATSYGRTVPAGARLLRAEPHPYIAFRHEDLARALRDAKALQEYLNSLGQGISKAQQKRQNS